ncbi:SO_0444 family Cu/Zn efflux transporter [Thalassotalea fusca]
MADLFSNFIQLCNEASPWLLLGLIIAGLMKSWLPANVLSRHLGQGKKAIVKAALIGAPLPLCSCGVIPVATELRRSGASSPATASFLVATPETGVDSVSVSYALLGPVMAIYRPFAAIMSAIITGLLVATTKEQTVQAQEERKSCCHANSCKQTNSSASFVNKTVSGLKYAGTQLIDDLIIWLIIGLVFATIVRTYIPNELLIEYGSGLPAMILMILISIPMYICATASTPIAAGFIMAGISPGTALVFMMAGPATNISTLGVIKSEMGTPVLIRYLLGIALCSIAFGLLLDWLMTVWQINMVQQLQHSHEILPAWVGMSCTLLLTFFAIKPMRKFVVKP